MEESDNVMTRPNDRTHHDVLLQAVKDYNALVSIADDHTAIRPLNLPLKSRNLGKLL